MNNEPNYDYFPSLETDRLKLRPLVVEDVNFFFRLLTDPRVTQYTMDEPLLDCGQAGDLIQFYLGPGGKTENRWTIMHKEDGRLIGTCGLHKWDQQYMRAEIGCDLSPDYWGRGYMTEALQVAIRNGFERMKLNRIEAIVYIKNSPSIRLLERLGFQREGTLRDYYYLNGKFHDQYIFSLLQKEVKSQKGKAHNCDFTI
jgi:[ribosomal protein S5]-alanine N-acetyltransferase